MPLLKKALFLSLILFLQSGAGIFGAAAALDNRLTGLIPQGVTVKGVPVGGLSPAEAAKKLEINLPPPAQNDLTIEGAGKSFTMKLSEIGAKYDYLLTAYDARNYYDQEKYINQLMTVLRLRAEPADRNLRITCSIDRLEEKLKSLREEWDLPPLDAEVTMSDGRVMVVPEQAGYSLDYKKTLEQALNDLSQGNLHITAAGQVKNPDVTAADLAGINTLLAEYTTAFDAGAYNRSHNIALASASVNGCLLKPGEMFSLNERLGPRLADTGYLTAPVFIGDYLGLDIGGGICQVATTLYNAVIFAGLPVSERYPHPLPVSYVDPGFDATIAGDYLDLKFTNDMDTPVYISSLTEDGTITVRIFGAERADGEEIRITSEQSVIDPEVVIIHDETIPEGENRVLSPGKPGYEIRVYKEVIKDDQVESRTLISSDYFESEKKVVQVGLKPKEEQEK